MSCSPTQHSSSQVSHPHPSLWPWGLNRPRPGYRRPRTWGPWIQSLYCPSASVSTSGLSVPQYPLASRHTHTQSHTHRTVARKSFRRLLIPLSIDIPALPAHIDKHRLAANSLLKTYTKRLQGASEPKAEHSNPWNMHLYAHTRTHHKYLLLGSITEIVSLLNWVPNHPAANTVLTFMYYTTFGFLKVSTRLGQVSFSSITHQKSLPSSRWCQILKKW